jgi:hypothetical protein
MTKYKTIKGIPLKDEIINGDIIKFMKSNGNLFVRNQKGE